VAGKVKAVKPRTKKTPPANDMPPKAITNVPALVAAEPAPREIFQPDLRHGDCFEIMKRLPDSSVDLILVDPPYAMTRLKVDPLIDLDEMWAEYRRIITPTGTIVAFGSQPFSSRLTYGALDLFKHDLIWIKSRATGGLHARNRPLKQHEDILVFSAGTAVHANQSSRRYTYNPLGQQSAGIRVTSAGRQSTHLRDMICHPGREFEGTTCNPRTTLFCPKDGNTHAFQKPVALLEYLIRTYCNEGDVVLDTFLGSGSTCIAAMKAGRRSIGIEMDAEHFAAAEKRINSLISARPE
jgi:site-specific DNA-methyltransferase (adenine-specific)